MIIAFANTVLGWISHMLMVYAENIFVPLHHISPSYILDLNRLIFIVDIPEQHASDIWM